MLFKLSLGLHRVRLHHHPIVLTIDWPIDWPIEIGQQPVPRMNTQFIGDTASAKIQCKLLIYNDIFKNQHTVIRLVIRNCLHKI